MHGRKKTGPQAGLSNQACADYLVAAASTAGVVVAVASVVAAGASTAAGATGAASSFLLQAARATAIRETISRDFFMIFLNISKVSTACLNNNYR
jgi:hypothetical protein